MKRASSLFRQHLVLLVALILFGQASSTWLFFRFSQRPRIEVFVSIAAKQLSTVRATLIALPPEARQTFLEQLNAGGAIAVSTTPPTLVEEIPSGIPRLVVDLLDRDLAPEGIHAALTEAPGPRLVASWPDGGTTYWATFPEIPFAPASPVLWVSVSCTIGLLSLLGAWLIQKRLHRPLDQLVAAAAQVGAGRAAPHLAEDGPREIAMVSHAFNSMVTSLGEIDTQRALMLAGVSHDLRTPLTKVRLALGILEGKIEEGLASQMIRSVEEMDRLIEQFLDFARIDSDEGVSEVRLRDVILDCLAGAALSSELYRIAPDQDVLLVGRPRMLRRLVANLIDNARKYGDLAPDRPLIIGLARDNGWATLLVSDQGSGFPTEGLADLTRPFVRGGDPALASGSGLGLAIVSRIVSLHGGRLLLGANPQGGARVEILLPLLPETSSRRTSLLSAAPR